MQFKIIAAAGMLLCSPAFSASLDCTVAMLCTDGACVEGEAIAPELARVTLSDSDGAEPRLHYRGEEIAMAATSHAGALLRFAGVNAAGENQGFAFKPANGSFVAVTVSDGSTTAKASGSCEVK